MKIVVTAHPLQNEIRKPPLITDLESLLELFMNQLDAIDSNEKKQNRKFQYTVKIVQTEE